MTRFTPALTAGLLAGLLFFGHAMIDGSRAWPLVWPFVGGAAAVLFAGRAHRLHGFWSGLRAGAGAGALSAALFVVTTVAALAALGSLPPERTTEVVTLLAIAAGLGFALATAAGAMAYPLARAAERA